MSTVLESVLVGSGTVVLIQGSNTVVSTSQLLTMTWLTDPVISHVIKTSDSLTVISFMSMVGQAERGQVDCQNTLNTKARLVNNSNEAYMCTISVAKIHTIVECSENH